MFYIINMDTVISLLIVIFLLFFYLLTKLIYHFIEIYEKSKRRRARELAITIMERFEQMLSNKNIKIPNENRENKKDEACIYGSDYYDLEDSITEILEER